MSQSRSRRAAWRGWLVSLLLHALAAAGLVYAVRDRPIPVADPIADTRRDDERSLLIWDEPVRLPGRKQAEDLPNPAIPPGPIVPVTVPKAVQPADSAPLLEPVDPKLVPPTPAMPPAAVSPNTAPSTSAHPPPIPLPAAFPSPSAGGGPGAARTASGGGTRSQLPVSPAAKSVVFVLDRSASMGIDDRLDLARAEILAAVRQMSPGARFQVVYYNRQVDTTTIGGRTGLVPVTALAINELTAALEALVPEGGNDHGPALRAALSLEPDMVCLLTDADDLTPQLVTAVTAWNRGRCAIHAVTIGSAPRQAMATLAARNRGTCTVIAVRR